MMAVITRKAARQDPSVEKILACIIYSMCDDCYVTVHNSVVLSYYIYTTSAGDATYQSLRVTIQFR